LTKAWCVLWCLYINPFEEQQNLYCKLFYFQGEFWSFKSTSTFIQRCSICRSSDSILSDDSRIEPWTVATLGGAGRETWFVLWLKLKRAPASPALAEAVQLGATTDSSCWYIVSCTQTLIITQITQGQYSNMPTPSLWSHVVLWMISRVLRGFLRKLRCTF